MRSDYVLYVVAVICFIIAGVFIANAIQLATTDMNLAATVVFFILGIIFAVGGYALRPKVAAPMPAVSQPPPVEPSLPPPQLPPVEEKVEEAPAVPPPVVEVPPPVEEAPVVEPTPPPVEEAAPTEPTPVPTVEEPAKIEEAKPKEKPARRRRKKAAKS
jgi:type IV secretory pathway VirB10-like protein